MNWYGKVLIGIALISSSIVTFVASSLTPLVTIDVSLTVWSLLGVFGFCIISIASGVGFIKE